MTLLAHRQAPHSVRTPLMHQTWATFGALHWRYDPAVIQRRLPEALTVDTLDGAAWISITPFLMDDVRLGSLPPVPRLSRFPETNVRTYVRDREGRAGLWFFTLEAASLGFAAFARTTLGVPYTWAQMDVETRSGRICYRSRRRPPGTPEARSRIVLTPGARLADDEVTELDDFLTARWRGYAPTPLGLCFLPVEHEPWPLRRGRLEELDETLLACCALAPPEGEPVVHCSDGVHVRFGAPVPVARRSFIPAPGGSEGAR